MTDDHVARGHQSPRGTDEPVHEVHELVLIQRYRRPPVVRRGPAAGSRWPDRRPYHHARTLRRALAGEKPRVALDVACGTGLSTRGLAELGIAAVGVEVVPAMVARARADTALPYAVATSGGSLPSQPGCCAGRAARCCSTSTLTRPRRTRRSWTGCGDVPEPVPVAAAGRARRRLPGRRRLRAGAYRPVAGQGADDPRAVRRVPSPPRAMSPASRRTGSAPGSTPSWRGSSAAAGRGRSASGRRPAAASRCSGVRPGGCCGGGSSGSRAVSLRVTGSPTVTVSCSPACRSRRVASAPSRSE